MLPQNTYKQGAYNPAYQQLEQSLTAYNTAATAYGNQTNPFFSATSSLPQIKDTAVGTLPGAMTAPTKQQTTTKDQFNLDQALGQLGGSAYNPQFAGQTVDQFGGYTAPSTSSYSGKSVCPFNAVFTVSITDNKSAIHR